MAKVNNDDNHEHVRVSPTRMDVLCGIVTSRQNDTLQNNNGNILFESFVMRFIRQYSQSRFSNEAKEAITTTVLDLLTKSGIRFLQMCYVCDFWYVAPQGVARGKIHHLLQEHESKTAPAETSLGRNSALDLPCLSSFASPVTIAVAPVPPPSPQIALTAPAEEHQATFANLPVRSYAKTEPGEALNSYDKQEQMRTNRLKIVQDSCQDSCQDSYAESLKRQLTETSLAAVPLLSASAFSTAALNNQALASPKEKGGTDQNEASFLQQTMDCALEESRLFRTDSSNDNDDC